MSLWWKEISKCLFEKDNDEIMSMLKKIPNKDVANTRDRCGNTLLHYVAKSNNKELASFLISLGCDVNAKNDDGDPPLVGAITSNSKDMVSILIDNNVILSNCYYANSCGPLHKAAKHGRSDIFDILLKAGCETIRDGYGLSVLHYAVLTRKDSGVNQHKEKFLITKSLIKLGNDVNDETNDKVTLLHYASKYDTGDIVKLLLDAGAQINKEDQKGRTELFWASMHGNLEVAKIFLQAGADIHKTDKNGMTSLHYAVVYLQPKMIEFLIDNGANVDAVDLHNVSPLWYCLKRCCLPYESAKYFIKTCDKVIERDHSEQWEDQVLCLKVLLENGASVNYVNPISHYGNSPLEPIYSALFVNHSEIVKLLLKHKAIFDYEHKLGKIALNRFNSQISKSVHLVLRHTAKLNANDKNDRLLNFQPKNLKKFLQTYYAQCRDELESMKNSYVYGTVTLYKILECTNIEHYVRNEQVVYILESGQLEKKFPIYYDLLIDRYQAELERQEKIQECLCKLYKVLNVDKNHIDIIFNNVFPYLDKKDLRLILRV